MNYTQMFIGKSLLESLPNFLNYYCIKRLWTQPRLILILINILLLIKTLSVIRTNFAHIMVHKLLINSIDIHFNKFIFHKNCAAPFLVEKLHHCKNFPLYKRNHFPFLNVLLVQCYINANMGLLALFFKKGALRVRESSSLVTWAFRLACSDARARCNMMIWDGHFLGQNIAVLHIFVLCLNKKKYAY